MDDSNGFKRHIKKKLGDDLFSSLIEIAGNNFREPDGQALHFILQGILAAQPQNAVDRAMPRAINHPNCGDLDCWQCNPPTTPGG